MDRKKNSKHRSNRKNSGNKSITISKKSYLTLQEITNRFSTVRQKLFLPRFLRRMKKLKIGGLSGGNRIQLLNDGDDCFDEFITSMKKARLSINMETYIFKSDEVGWKVAEILAGKALAGIEVNLIYDSWGCLGTSPAIFSYMRDAGVELIAYRPFLTLKRIGDPFFRERDHRKILVIDGRTAFIGGVNIGNEYAGKNFSGQGWRDTHLKIEGPSVKDVQFFFIENWYRSGGEILEQKNHFPNIRSVGKKIIMIMGSKGKKNLKPIKESYLSAIRYAQHSIYITNAYFIPTAKVLRALLAAAKRGVDVRLLLPGKTDVPFVKFGSRYLYKKYLKQGIRVFEYGKSVLHAKTAVIDGCWATVGSSNLDALSFRRNLEINAVILDQDACAEMEKQFFHDLKFSTEFKLEDIARRSLPGFFVEWFFYRFRNIL